MKNKFLHEELSVNQSDLAKVKEELLNSQEQCTLFESELEKLKEINNNQIVLLSDT